jgi:hypothetical protein
MGNVERDRGTGLSGKEVKGSEWNELISFVISDLILNKILEV